MAQREEDVAHHEDLRGLVVDWGGVLTNSIRTTVKSWVEAEDISWDSYVACMRPWLTEAYGGPEAAGNQTRPTRAPASPSSGNIAAAFNDNIKNSPRVSPRT